MPDIEIKALSASPYIRAMPCDILIETVANGGSVSFVHPLAQRPSAAGGCWCSIPPSTKARPHHPGLRIPAARRPDGYDDLLEAHSG